MKCVAAVSDAAQNARVGDAWAIVHSVEVGQFYVEELLNAFQKNYRSFLAEAGEDWQIVGVFGSYEEAHDAVTVWIRTPNVHGPTKASNRWKIIPRWLLLEGAM